MRIRELHIRNFRAFTDFTLRLNPDSKSNFVLLVGRNGSGKTSILEALACSLSIWKKALPDSQGWRTPEKEDLHLIEQPVKDRTTFVPASAGITITAHGELLPGDAVSWSRSLVPGKTKNHFTLTESRPQDMPKGERAEDRFKNHIEGAQTEVKTVFPVLAYYGAGRAWLSTRERKERAKEQEKLDKELSKMKRQRFSAYHHCLTGKIREEEINLWFRDEKLAELDGKPRSGFKSVKQAVMDCVPGCQDLRYDTDRKEIVLKLEDRAIPFSCLSDGQRMLVAMVGDLAIKCLTLNPDLGDDCTAKSPGVVLIDELDLHLHPAWQRGVPSALKKSFPTIQFICTSHSPQILGELRYNEIYLLPKLTESEVVGKDNHPPLAFGADSGRILDHVMDGALSRNADIAAKLTQVERDMDAGHFAAAKAGLDTVRSDMQGLTDEEITRLDAMIHTLEGFAE